MIETFSKQIFVPRTYSLETPHSYLQRVCQRNMIDISHILRQTSLRSHLVQSPLALGSVIQELGGPRARVFAANWINAGNNPHGSRDLENAFRRTRYTRSACLFCTRGEDVATFDHEKQMICLKHGRWIYPQPSGRIQRQVPDSWYRAERTFRRVQTSSLLPNTFHRRIWDLIRDNALMLDNVDWGTRVRQAQARAGFRTGLDDRIALFPETVRVLATCNELDIWTHLLRSTPRSWEAWGDGERLRAVLREKLRWTGAQTDTWVLIEGLAIALAKIFTDEVSDVAYARCYQNKLFRLEAT